jgi:glycosyltransferase involved in cell wall biosynthesis
VNRQSMSGVAMVFEDNTGRRNEGRLNAAWGLATCLTQHGGLVAAVPTLGKYRGRWRGCGARASLAVRATWRLRRSRVRGTTLVYFSVSSLTLGGVVRGLLYRVLSGSGRLIIIASQRLDSSFLVAFTARLMHISVVTFDSRYARLLRAKGVACRSVVPGIDRSIFARPSQAEKTLAAKALGMDQGERCILHVGHLNRQRGLDVLAQVASRCAGRVVVVAGSATESDEQLARQLLDVGAVLIREDLDDIRRVYCAADVYVFPTSDAAGAIGFPLSVLEALAVGVPVVSTPFNDLPDVLPEGSGVRYARSSDEFCRMVDEILAADSPPAIDEGCLRGWEQVLEEVVNG